MAVVSVVVPVYFNEGSLPALFSALSAVESELAESGDTLDLTFVDDGSGDGSLRELLRIKEQRPQTRVVKLTRNFGAVHATKTGLRFVEGDCFMVLAADLQDPPSLIPEMLKRWRAGSKFVICVRAGRDDPFLARLFAWLYYTLVRTLVVRGYPSTGFDLALMDKAMLPYLRDSPKNVYTPLYSYWLGFTPSVLPYHRQKRVHGRSRWSFRKRLTASLDSILGFSIIPIRIISLIGALVSLGSIVYGIVVFANAILGNTIVPGFATLVSLITFLLGLIIIMLGVIGEYLWRTFDEVGSKPEAVIDEIY